MIKSNIRIVFVATVAFLQYDSCSCAEEQEYTIIDPTVNLSTESPCASSAYEPKISIIDSKNDQLISEKCYPHTIFMPSNAATCITAPSYFEGNWKTVNSIKPSELVVKCYMIDLSEQTGAGMGITIDDIMAFERRYEKIEEGSFVIFYTGWAKQWSHGKQYVNNFPTVTPEAADYLVKKGIVGIGTDTPAPDNKAQKFPSQQILFAKDKYVVKNLSSEAGKIPPVGATIIIAPLKFEGSNESPCRIFVINKHKEKSKIKGLLKKIF